MVKVIYKLYFYQLVGSIKLYVYLTNLSEAAAVKSIMQGDGS